MDKQINFKQLLIALLVAMSPTFFVMWSNSKSELKKTVDKHTVVLENHSLRIDLIEKDIEYTRKLLEENSKYNRDKLEKIYDGVVDLKIKIKDKQDRQ